MKVEYYKQYSPCMGRDMECKVYGHDGIPLLFIPCQDGHFYDFENFKMIDIFEPYIEYGQVTVFAIDACDQESWSDKDGDPGYRSWRYDQWMHFLADEIAPFIHSLYDVRHPGTPHNDIIVYGASLGAAHAVNAYFRFPDTFTGLLALSGVYSVDFAFGGYMDEKLYNNSPIHYLGGMPYDHPYIEKYRRNNAIICTGLGAWEIPEYTRDLQRILEDKGIPAWVDYWGTDCVHDWDWWFKQVHYFLPKLLEDMYRKYE